MNSKPENPLTGDKLTLRDLARKAWKVVIYRWPWKLASLALGVLLWGGLISQDATLTREKTFADVSINVINHDSLLRTGLIVVDGLDGLEHIRVRADVPQKMYDNVTAGNFNIRVDLGRITAPGKQTLPVMYTSSGTYGTVTWLSLSEVSVDVENYITRRRIPVQLNETGRIPDGFYATNATVDPTIVNISGPGSLVQRVVRCVAAYNTSLLAPSARTQFSAVPFRLFDEEGQEVSSDLINVTSDSVLLDTVLVEQTLYRLRPIAINTSGVTLGQPARGYHVVDIKVDPSMLNIAGSNELMETLTMLDVVTPIDISGASETLIRSVKIKKPDEAYHMSENAVYVTVTIEADPPVTEAPQ